MIRCASAFPSSTPHWSNELMLQIVALREHAVLVERDERAERVRRELFGEETFDGRLPSKIRCGTSRVGGSLRAHLASVFPNASASAWAKTFDIRRS